MMTHQEAIAKASKLLKLSESSNPNEAALAAQRAQEILVKYDIDQSMLALAQNDVQPVEPIKKHDILEVANRLATWKPRLASSIARVNSCRIYLSGGSIGIVGRTSNVERVRYLYAFLSLEVDRLAKLHSKGQGRSFAASFRNGCVAAIGDKLKEAVGKAQNEARCATASEGALTAVNHAIARVAAKDADVDAWMRQNMNLRAGRRSYSSGGAGYGAGYQAGQSINMGSGGNGRVGSGQKRLG